VIVDAVGAPVWAEVDPDRPPSIEHAFVAVDGEVPTLERGTPRAIHDAADSDVAALLFTSGTAGTPRAAMLTHENFWSSMRSVLSLGLPLKGEGHVALAVIPLFHIFGLNLIVNLGFTIGATLVLEDHVSAQRTRDLVKEHRATVVSGPPTLWNALAADETADPADFDSVVLAVSGAAPLDPRVAKRVSERLGIDIREGYGLTETSGIVSSALGDADAPLGSVGSPFPGVEVRLVDDQGADVLIGDPGEVWVRGPMVSPGYWNDPAVTAATRTDDGWLRTGDLAVVDEHGSLAIIDRIKDLIIVSGFNVHPGEVERALSGHPLVAAAGVVGEPSEATGEQVVAHVVVTDETAIADDGARAATIDALTEHCRTELARYKVPKRFVFTSELPRVGIGKLRRSDLVD
jgi:long-chain acyl-CoA synthetase